MAPLTTVFVTLVSEGQQPNPAFGHLPAVENSMTVATEIIDVITVDKAVLRGRTRMAVILLNGLTQERLADEYPEVYTSLKISLRALGGSFLEVPTHHLVGVAKPRYPVEAVE